MMAQQFYLQMSGVPGSGKSTVAAAVAEATDGVIIDHDITKSALLEAGVPPALARKASYSVLKSVAGHLLMQGKSVIFDSPCFYDSLLESGMQLARRFGAAYLYIECVLNDLEQLDRRLRSRPRHPSQVAGVQGQPTPASGEVLVNEQVFLEWMRGMKRPAGDYLVLDTSDDIEAVTQAAVAYVFSRIH
jgi:predicted kinase